MALFVVAKSLWLFATPLRSGSLPLRFAQDDFFYYLKAAQTFAWFHRPTLDGTTPTNGFHPLYFLLLTAVSFFARTLRAVFRFLWLLDSLSAVSIFFLTRRLFARVPSPTLADALAVLMTSLCFSLLSDQMEVTLALPLGFAFLLLSFVSPEEITEPRAAAMGFTGALLFLARLDAGLLVLLYVLGLLACRSYRAVLTPTITMAFLGACLPLPLLYLGLNQHFFGTWLPISGMAKQLRHGYAPSVLVPRSFSGINEALVLSVVFAAVLGWACRRRLAPRERVFLFATLAFPFVFYGIEAVGSDWPLWSWYFYALRFAVAGAGVLLAVTLGRARMPWRTPSPAMVRGVAYLLLVGGTLKMLVAKYRVDVVMEDIQTAAERLQSFRATHPGTYAMGDRSGMFAMLGSSPVVQAEGLMMDRDYLQHVRHEEDLLSVLATHQVEYYVAFSFDRNHEAQWQGNCFHALEPSIPGPSALRMRSTICDAPLLQFRGLDGTYSVFKLHPSYAMSRP